MKNGNIDFETLKTNKKRIYFLCGFVCVVVLLIILITNSSLAKYRVTENIPLIYGTINYTPYDLKMVAMYQENNGNYESIDTVPTSGYSLNEEKSYCEINDTEDNNITIEYKNGVINFLGMTKRGTKCYLYFDESKRLKDMILANNTINNGTPNFANVATTDEGIYKTEDDWGESYYFRGAVTNNWVKFAGYYWRIIRINGDGSIRVIYNGTSTKETGNSTMINNGAYRSFNDDYNRSEYVGYMYTKGEQHGNTTNSDIKTEVDKWYNSNLASHTDKISKEAGFCGDRELQSGYSWSSQPSSDIYYKANERLNTNKSPSLKCSNSADLYTVSGSIKGNHALSNPVGLITSDEVAMAGGVYGQTNESYYLYNKQAYWTMTPCDFEGGSANVCSMHSNGTLMWHRTYGTASIRPVINIASDVVIKSGNGTSSTPYEV